MKEQQAQEKPESNENLIEPAAKLLAETAAKVFKSSVEARAAIAAELDFGDAVIVYDVRLLEAGTGREIMKCAGLHTIHGAIKNPVCLKERVEELLSNGILAPMSTGAAEEAIRIMDEKSPIT